MRNRVDQQSLAIGVLSVTATVLFVGLMLAPSAPIALGIGQNDRSGDYVMLTQQLSSSQESVIVIDGASKRMCVYAFDNSNKRLGLIERNIPLDRLPGATNAKGGTEPPNSEKP
jgi:hypothetical protein